MNYKFNPEHTFFTSDTHFNHANMIDKLDEMGMLYFVIGSLFSADTLIDLESCEKSLKGVEKLKAELPTSKYKDDPKIKQYIDDAEEIIRLDLKQFKKAEK